MRFCGLASVRPDLLTVVLLELGLLLPFVHLGDWLTRAGMDLRVGQRGLLKGKWKERAEVRDRGAKDRLKTSTISFIAWSGKGCGSQRRRVHPPGTGSLCGPDPSAGRVDEEGEPRLTDTRMRQ